VAASRHYRRRADRVEARSTRSRAAASSCSASSRSSIAPTAGSRSWPG